MSAVVPHIEESQLVAKVPSASYAITVRLQLPAGGSAVSQLTAVVEEAEGMVTALDVTGSGAEAIQVDVTCAAKLGRASDRERVSNTLRTDATYQTSAGILLHF